jgi:hypothetical protein
MDNKGKGKFANDLIFSTNGVDHGFPLAKYMRYVRS